MVSGKLTPKLTEALETLTQGPLEVVVELHEPHPGVAIGAGRAEQMAARKSAFSKHAEAVAGQIRSLGGEVTGEAWINGTMRARLPKEMVSALSEVPQVKTLDIPRPIQADASK
jgi:hypothetical protein